MALLTFVRQFANVAKPWFNTQPWPNLIRRLDAFTASPRFAAIMHKYPQWQPGDTPVAFPPPPETGA
jgi:hypothetical protein